MTIETIRCLILIDNACGASPATPSAQSTKNLDFEGSECLQAASGGLGGPLLRPLGDLSGASWGPRRRKNHPENANWPKETPKSSAGDPEKPQRRSEKGPRRAPNGAKRTPRDVAESVGSENSTNLKNDGFLE